MLEILQEQASLQNLQQAITWGFFTALLSLFLDFCFRESNIFEGWLDFWADRWLRKNKPEILEFVKEKTDEDIKLLTLEKWDSVREYKHDHVEWFWWKPLGGCVVCMNVWISFFFILFFPATVLGYLFYVLFSNFLVRFFHERVL